MNRDPRIEQSFTPIINQPVADFDAGTLASFEPAAGIVLIRVDDAESITKGGIVIPDSAKETPCIGVVVAKGENVPEKYARGCRVLFPPHIGEYANFMGVATYKLFKAIGDDCEILGSFAVKTVDDGKTEI